VPKLSAVADRSGDSPRWPAGGLLEGDDLACGLAAEAVSESELKAIAGDLADDIDILFADSRYGLAHAPAKATVKKHREVSANRSDRIDRVMLNGRWEFPYSSLPRI
jgi:ferrous iron transport protein B